MIKKILCCLSLFLVLGAVGCTKQTPTSSSSTTSTQLISSSSSDIDSSSAASSSSLESSSSEQSSSTAGSTSVVYKDSQYGLLFTLPDSWSGYTIVKTKWTGNPSGDSSSKKAVVNGPILSIRSPKWTAKVPRQDIPIMVFTISQWNSLRKEEFSVSAAPINPSELGRNSKYVFALPARYNYAFLPGYEEVETILKSKPLKTF